MRFKNDEKKTKTKNIACSPKNKNCPKILFNSKTIPKLSSK